MKLNSFKSYLINIDIKHVLFLALFVRFLTLIIIPNQIFPDSNTYSQMADELLSGNVVNTILHMPGYAIWLKIGNSITNNSYGVKFLDIIISSLSVWVIYLLSKKIFKSEIAAKISAIISAFYPYFIFFSITGLSENLFIFLLLCSFLCLYNKKIIIASVLLTCSTLIKGSTDYIYPIILIIFLFFIYKSKLKECLIYLAKYIVIYCILMTPWWIHNWNKYDQFVRLSLADGHHLYIGNNIKNIRGTGIGGVDVDFREFDKYQKNPIEQSKKYKIEVKKFITENPRDFLLLTSKKMLKFWSFYPNAEEYKSFFYVITSIMSYGIIFLLSIIFLIRYGNNFFIPLLPIITFILFLMLIHSVTIVSIRYRLPIDPFLIIFASYQIKELLKLKD